VEYWKALCADGKKGEMEKDYRAFIRFMEKESGQKTKRRDYRNLSVANPMIVLL